MTDGLYRLPREAPAPPWDSIRALYPFEVVATDTRVCWSTQEDVRCQARPGGTRIVTRLEPGAVARLSAEGDAIYLGTSQPCRVARIEDDLRTLHTCEATLTDLHVGRSSVWITLAEPGAIRRIDRQDGTVTEVATGLIAPNSLVLDEAEVQLYWTDLGEVHLDEGYSFHGEIEMVDSGGGVLWPEGVQVSDSPLTGRVLQLDVAGRERNLLWDKRVAPRGISLVRGELTFFVAGRLRRPWDDGSFLTFAPLPYESEDEPEDPDLVGMAVGALLGRDELAPIGCVHALDVVAMAVHADRLFALDADGLLHEQALPCQL